MTRPFGKTPPHQVWPTGPVWTATCTTFIPAYLNNNNSSSLPPLHPHLQDHLPLHLISTDPGIMAPVPGPTVNVGTVTAVKTVKESIHVSTAPFQASASLDQHSRSSSPPRSKRQRHWDHGHHMSFGQGTLLAKFDVKSAYQNIPVNPEDRYLLGMKWQDNYFINMVLPFGLRSAPFIFSSLSSSRVAPQT